MAKGIRSIEFSFVPFPAEVWDENIPISLGEFRLLGYLCKQIRFGEALKAITDDELMHGIWEKDQREDKGCGLSRNGIKQAREALLERGWIEAENISKDLSRPKWMYRLCLTKRPSVTARQLVSPCDSGTEGQKASSSDSAPSQRDTGAITEKQLVSPADTASVTARQLVSQRDTCNKEEEDSKYLDKELEVTNTQNYKLEKEKAEILSAPVSQISEQQSNLDAWDLRRWREEMQNVHPPVTAASIGSTAYYEQFEEKTKEQRDQEWLDDARIAAYRAGVPLQRLHKLIKPYFPDDPKIDRLVPQPPLFQPKPAESEDDIRQTIERSLPKTGSGA